MKSPKHQCFGLSMFSENSNQKKSDSFEDPCIFYRCYFFSAFPKSLIFFCWEAPTHQLVGFKGHFTKPPLV